MTSRFGTQCHYAFMILNNYGFVEIIDNVYVEDIENGNMTVDYFHEENDTGFEIIGISLYNQQAKIINDWYEISDADVDVKILFTILFFLARASKIQKSRDWAAAEVRKRFDFVVSTRVFQCLHSRHR